MPRQQTVHLKQFGFDIIVRHDYSNPEQLNKINNYRQASFEYFKKYLENLSYADQLRTFLDVGCYDEFNIKQAAAMKLQASGVDLYPAEDSLFIQKTDFYDLASSGNKYDVVFCNHTLEHADSVYRLMEQMTEVTKKNGLLFISVPDGESEWAYSLYQSTTHYSILTYGFLLTTMQRFGFNVIPHRVELRPGCPELWFIGIKN